MDRLTEQKAGNKATAKWANEVVAELRRLSIIPGNGIRKTVTSNGTVLDLDIPQQVAGGQKSTPLEDAVYFAVAVGNSEEDGSFKADLYTSKFGEVVARNATVFLPDLTHFTRIQKGTELLVHRISVTLLAGDDGET